MATPVPEMTPTPTPEIVAQAFAEKYYDFLSRCPEIAYRFYEDSSCVSHIESDKKMMSVTTKNGINEMIMSSNYKDCLVKIETVDAQASSAEGVIVLVTGHLTKKDAAERIFTQTFYLAPNKENLAPQTKGYFVLNDILQFVEPCKQLAALPVEADINAHSATLNQEAETTLVPNPSVQNHASTPSQKANDDGGKLSGLLDNKSSVVEDVVVTKSSIGQSLKDKQEISQKISYASILAKEGIVTSSPTVVRVAPSSNVQIKPSSNGLVVVPSSNGQTVQPSTNGQVVGVASSATVQEAAPSSVDQRLVATSNEQQKPASVVSRASGPRIGDASQSSTTHRQGNSVYIGALPSDITVKKLQDVVNKFGPVKNNGIQLHRSAEDGFCYGFVEFVSPESAQNAIQARNITVWDGWTPYITEKRSPRQFFGGSRNGNLKGGQNFAEGRKNGRYENGNRNNFSGRAGGNRSDFSSETRGNRSNFSGQARQPNPENGEAYPNGVERGGTKQTVR